MEENKKGNKALIILLFITTIIVLGLGICGIIENSNKNNKYNNGSFIIIDAQNNNASSNIINTQNNKYLAYRLTGNFLENFDLSFLQLETQAKNKLYSPLSIKYALKMLEEGANGESKEQISNITGTYSAKKYTNNSNMSFANAIFIKDSFKNSINDSYVTTLSSKYDAEVIYDSFKTPNILNSWVSNKTFKLINNGADDISREDIILINALAIDMEWVNKIQSEDIEYYVDYAHENYIKIINPLLYEDYHELEFSGFSKKAKSAEIGAVINKYDIVSILGEDNIRENITKKYQEWLTSKDYKYERCSSEEDKDVKTYVDDYIKEINQGYNDISSSTDFYFYTDKNVKVFAKDLKEYDGTTLQYVGIMPKKDNLDKYIYNIKSTDINSLIGNLKSIELNNFKDGVITEIYGYIPMFKFDYQLSLIKDLKKLGITNIFDSKKADLSKISSSNISINSLIHKANIEFSNDGIKSAAVTEMGAAGAGDCGFDYLYDVPVEKIDLTFDKPYMFIIRDKNSGEVWFAGTVYSPIEYISRSAL